MKRSIIALGIGFIFMGIMSICAESAPGRLPKYAWECGAEVSDIFYEEPGLMEEEGRMYGVTGSYTYRGWISPAPEKFDRAMLKVEGRLKLGEVDYKGALMDGTPYEIKNIEESMWEVRGLEGYGFSLSGTTFLTPYIGIGYRYLNDDSSEDPAGYERESNYLYSPVGLEISTALGKGWSFEAAIEYDIFWKGRQKSYIRYAYSRQGFLGYDDIENDQMRGYGCRGCLKIEKKGKRIGFAIKPFIRYWNIKNSNMTPESVYGIPYNYVHYVEPKNNSTEYGVEITIGF